jgi:hypothetical protein
MNQHPLIRQTLVSLALALAIGFPLILWDLTAARFVSASEKKAPAQKKPDQHDHGGASEEEHGAHDDHAKEEKHEHAKAQDSKKEDEHGHEHGKEEKEEEGHGHAHGEGEEEGHGDHEEEEGGARFGPGKAITAANKKDGIQLSEKAIKTLGLSYVAATGDGTFKLPFKTAVFFQDEVGVYRLKNGWHKLIEVQLISKNANEVVIKTSELKSGDQIAKDGVPLLRAAELEAWGGSGDGHGH